MGLFIRYNNQFKINLAGSSGIPEIQKKKPQEQITHLYNIKNLGHKQINESSALKLNTLKFLFRNKPERLFIKAINYIIRNNKSAALKHLQYSLQEKPDLTDANFLLALLTDNEEERLTAVKRAAEKYEQFGRLFKKYRIWLSLDIELTPDIRLQLTNDNTGFFLYIAEVLEEEGELSKAISLLENSGLLENELIRLSLGELYYITGYFDRSIRVLQGIDKEETIHTYALLLLGMAFREKGMKKAAIDTLRKTRRQRVNQPLSLILEGMYQLALTLKEDGKGYLARKEYEKILAVDYDYRDVRIKLAELNNIIDS